jgi:hypothetical protein
MARMLKLIKQDKPEAFEAVMHLFINYAKAGDIDKMIELTSQITIDDSGIDVIKNHYQQDTIPSLKQCHTISKGGKTIHVSEEESGTGAGWIYHKTCSYADNKSVPVQFVILRENDRNVLASFGAQ